MRLGKEPVITQLSKLALASRTGVLRLPGDNGGTIRLYQGAVAGAKSRGTPDVAGRLARWPAGPGRRGVPSVLERDWITREATADAALALLTQAPRSGRFTTGGVPNPDGVGVMTVGEMLAEVNRRREIIRQLASLLTPDTTVVRNPYLSARGVHISASQWALLVRMNDQATPRGLAMECGRSVFTTTLEVFRLMIVDLVAVADGPSPGKRAAGFAGCLPDGISFIQAVASEPRGLNAAMPHPTTGEQG
ncbi:hypothetical protein [Trebonia sp.]|uniref:hypothetical protein n=1 Tax=Trebonia sp. TaxID=2767075 RepID=UPI00260521F9|nr:hypothetical protein [Trebonia sp.]